MADLQDALKLCLDRAFILAQDPATRQQLATALAVERKVMLYGSATSQLVGIFHRELEVDESTADALNSLLYDLGILPRTCPPPAHAITFPLKQGMQGQAVADLQDALKLCLDRAFILANDPAMRTKLAAALAPERTTMTYGPATTQLVGIFHRELEVDESTAHALNSLLGEWGILAAPCHPCFQIPDTLNENDLSVRLRTAIAGAANAATEAIVWQDRGDEVVVHLSTLQVRLVPPAAFAAVDLESDQTGRHSLIVRFVFGDPQDPAGLFATTDEIVRGNSLLAARWGPIFRDLIWSALTRLSSDHAAERGLAPLRFSVGSAGLQLATSQSIPLPERVKQILSPQAPPATPAASR